MVTIKNMKVKPERPELTPPCIVDMDILEYFYAATFQDIICDKKLMDLIMTNGFYKQALCDAYQIEDLVLTHRGKDYKMKGTPHNVSSTLDMFHGKTKIVVLNTILENKELQNINKVTPLKER